MSQVVTDPFDVNGSVDDLPDPTPANISLIYADGNVIYLPLKPIPSFEMAAEHIRLLTGSADTPMCFRLLGPERGDGENLTGTLAELWSRIVEMQGQRWQVFVIPNDGGHADADITGVRCLFIDMDGKPVPERWHFEPSFLVHRDATHWHAYWMVGDCPTDAFKPAQRRLAAFYGSDPKVCNPSRVMRLAGTLHLKATPILVTLEDRDSCLGPCSLAELMAGLPEVATVERTRRTRPATAEENSLKAISMAKTLLSLRPVMAEDGDGDDFALAQRILDFGISPDKGTELAVDAGAEEEWAWLQFDHAATYRQDDFGRDAPRTAEDFAAFAKNTAQFVEAEAEPAFKQRQEQDQAKRFAHILPSEVIDSPPPVYWDADKLFLRGHQGSASMIYAAFSNFKTTYATGRMLAIAKRNDARVLYIVAEGADGFGPMTLQAAVKDWNDRNPGDPITPDWLDAHFHLVGQAVQIMDGADCEALIASCADWHPDLLVIDTLGAAAAGQNLSAIEVGTGIGAGMRRLVRALKCDGWLVHHLGKDEDAGPTGSMYLQNDTDTEMMLKHDPEKEVLSVTVKKDRWGVKDRTVQFGTHVADAGLGRRA